MPSKRARRGQAQPLPHVTGWPWVAQAWGASGGCRVLAPSPVPGGARGRAAARGAVLGAAHSAPGHAQHGAC